MSDSADLVETDGIGFRVSGIASLIKNGGVISAGDLAGLRRMDPRSPHPAFFKIEALLLEPELPGEADSLAELETRWAAVVAGLARLGGLHQSGRRLGQALANADYSELRFIRLIRASADQLADELPALARFCVAKGIPVDWSGAAFLVLSAGRPSEEPVRRHISRDYYGALARRQNA